MKQIQCLLFTWISVLCLNVATAQLVIAPDQAVMNLDDLGLHTVGYALRGKPEAQFPLGWAGLFDERIGGAGEYRWTDSKREAT